MYDQETWRTFQEQLGRTRASRVNQIGPRTYSYDVVDVGCPDGCYDHAVSISVDTINQCINTVKHLVGIEIM